MNGQGIQKSEELNEGALKWGTKPEGQCISHDLKTSGLFSRFCNVGMGAYWDRTRYLPLYTPYWVLIEHSCPLGKLVELIYPA